MTLKIRLYKNDIHVAGYKQPSNSGNFNEPSVGNRRMDRRE